MAPINTFPPPAAAKPSPGPGLDTQTKRLHLKYRIQLHSEVAVINSKASSWCGDSRAVHNVQSVWGYFFNLWWCMVPFSSQLKDIRCVLVRHIAMQCSSRDSVGISEQTHCRSSALSAWVEWPRDRVVVSLCAGLHLIQLTLTPRRQTIEIQSFVCHGNLLSACIYFTR